MQCAHNGGYVSKFSDSRRDPAGSAVLEVLLLLDVVGINLEKGLVTIVQPGGEKDRPAFLHLLRLKWYFLGSRKTCRTVVLHGC